MNEIKIKEVIKYLMQWKRFTTENDVGKREKLEKYKENSGRVQRKNKYRSKEARKVKLSKEKKF